MVPALTGKGAAATVSVTDVTLRDGLQTLGVVLPLRLKLRLYYYLRRCGMARLEVTSFVPPSSSPQFADAEQLLRQIAGAAGAPRAADLMAFAPNVKGLLRLAEFPVLWASTVVATSNPFNERNLRASTADVLGRLPAFVRIAKDRGMRVRLYLSTAFGCPYAGPMTPAMLEPLLAQIAAAGADEVALSDSIGTATPEVVAWTVELAKRHLAADALVLHLHGSGPGLLSCLDAAHHGGVRRFDGALAGLGGCPAAPEPTGNVATEELVRWLGGCPGAPAAAAVAAAAAFARSELGLPQTPVAPVSRLPAVVPAASDEAPWQRSQLC